MGWLLRPSPAWPYFQSWTMCRLRAAGPRREVCRHFLLLCLPLHPVPLLAFSIFTSVWTQALFDSVCFQPSLGNCLVWSAWLTPGSGPWSPQGHRTAGMKGEPSCQSPGQLPGRRAGQGLALSPGPQAHGLLLRGCPPPPSLGGRRKPRMLLQQSRRRRRDSRNDPREGKSGSPSLRTGGQSRKPPGQTEYRMR